MAETNSRTVERRNGCDIDLEDREVQIEGRAEPVVAWVYSVYTTVKPRRVIKKDVDSIEEARAIADQQAPESK